MLFLEDVAWPRKQNNLLPKDKHKLPEIKADQVAPTPEQGIFKCQAALTHIDQEEGSIHRLLVHKMQDRQRLLDKLSVTSTTPHVIHVKVEETSINQAMF